MSAVPAFPVVETDRGAPGALGFVAATLRRVTWRKVLVVAVALLLYSFYSSGLTMTNDPQTAPPPEMWLSGIVIEVINGAGLLLAVMAADEATARGSPRLRSYAIAIVVGSIVAGLLQYHVRAIFDLRTLLSAQPYLVRITQPAYVAFDNMITGAVATFVYVSVRTARLAATRYRDAEIARGVARRVTLESRLQAMQARIEPTFLFNTLAQVRALYAVDVALAGTMLDDLIAYLRAALPHLRETSSTLGKEAELARAYLNIVQIRLGSRLSFDIDVPDHLREARLPPMMLLPLIDHALVYGIGPTRDGGSIAIATEALDDRIRLSIADGGAGFVSQGGAPGLKDIEARLEALYGERGRLRLESMRRVGRVTGSCAILEIPYERNDGGHR